MVDEFVPWIPRVLRDTFALGAFRAPEPKDPTPEPFVNVSADELTISDWDNQLPREPSESGPLSFGDGVLFAIKLRGVPLFLCASGPDAHGTAVHLSDRPDESSSHWQVVEAAKSGLVVFARPGDRHVINAWRGSSDGAALRLYSNRQHPNSQFEVVPVGTDGRRCKIRVSDAILHVAASPSRGAPVRLQSRPLARHCEWELVPLNMGHRRPTDEHRPRGANGARAGSPGVRLADSGAEPRHKAGEHDRGAGHASPIPRRGGQLLPQAGRDVEMYGPEGYRHPVYQPSTGRQAPAPMAQPAARPVAQRCAAGAARREHGEAPAALAAPQPWRVPQPQPFRLPGLVEQGVKHWYDHGTRQWQSKPFPFVLDPAPFSEGAMRVAYRLESRSGEGPRCHVAKASKADCDPAVYYTDIEMQVECQAVADAFNALGPPKLVSFVPCFLLQRFRGAHHLRLLAVEPYLSGEYTKYNNNYGFVSFDDRNTPQAFSHYSHHQSQVACLRCILHCQGLCVNTQRYKATCPTRIACQKCCSVDPNTSPALKHGLPGCVARTCLCRRPREPRRGVVHCKVLLQFCQSPGVCTKEGMEKVKPEQCGNGTN